MHARALRDLLLRNRVVYRVNASLKARSTRRGVARLRAHYAAAARAARMSVSAEHTIRMVRARIRDRRTASPAGGPLRIFWVGANLPQDDSGFLQALRDAGELLTFTNEDGQYGLRCVSRDGVMRVYDPEVIRSNDAALLPQVEAAVRSGGLDLLMGQMLANVLSVETLRRIQELGVPTVNVMMDDRQPIHWQTRSGVRLGSIGLKDGLDLVLTTAPEVCQWYAVEGCPALYWPLGSHPAVFAPAPEQDKRYDVTFIGTRYGLRGEVVDALVAAGVSVECFGAGWPNGAVDVAGAARVFAQSRIILGVGTIGHNTDLYALKLRDFDAPMAGALYVTHRNPDLLDLYEEGREIVCYETIDECVAKVRHYLRHPDERRAIAAAGAEKARRSHTWAHRLAYVFDVLELRPREQGAGTGTFANAR